MDGAGIMNLPTNVGGGNSQNGLDSYAPLIAAQQAARDMGYPRFTRELLAAGSEMDPAEVQEFLQMIREAGLTSEDVALMRRVVEAVFGDPNNYPEVRARLLSEGVPEDLLPETFDLEFFTALRMAAEEAENIAQEPRPTEQEMPMEMADGGIAGLPQLTPVARELASMGRNGDTMLAHITPQEAMMLKRMGGSGSINPYTGLPEFFLGKIFKGISKGIKSIAKGIKKFAKSTVGRVVLSVALGAFLGPMATGFLSGALGTTIGAAAATGISAGVGVFGSSLLAGDGLKNSLRNGLMAGVTAYGVSGVTSGFNAPAPNAPTSFSQGVSQGVENIKAPFRALTDKFGSQGVGTAQDFAMPTTTESGMPLSEGYNVPKYEPGVSGPGSYSIANGTGTMDVGRLPDGTTIAKPHLFAEKLPPASSVNIPSDLGQGLPGGPGYQGSGVVDRISQGAQDLYQGGRDLVGRASQGIQDIYSEYLSPSRASIQPPSMAEAMQKVQADAAAGGITLKPETIYSEAQKLVAQGTPGTITKYGPMAALLAAPALPSLFKAPGQQEGESYEQYMARRKQESDAFAQARPEFFGSFLKAARGSGPQGVKNFPRKNGHISGPGTGTSDDVPAMLSDGEFVFTAKAVRNLGGGSRRKGAAKMYKLMKMLEGGPIGKTAKA